MQPNISRAGGFLKSSFFTTLIFCNFIVSICFVVMIAVHNVNETSTPQTEAIEQNPLQERVSEETAQLMRL